MATLTPAEATELFRRPPDRLLDVGAGQVACRTVGSGPDVLFVHGWPVSGATYRLLLPHLVEHVTCHVIDLPGAGSSQVSATDSLTIEQHFESIRRSIGLLELDDVAVVGHDSGGMMARHAMAGDPRLRSMGLVNTEPTSVGWRFRSFIAARHAPGFGAIFGWLAGQQRLRRNKFVLGDAFADRSLLDGEFDEFFLQPLHTSKQRQADAVRALRSFDMDHVTSLADVHRRIDVPVQLVWGVEDPFFPVASAREMVDTFPDAQLTEIPDAGLFSHEERPAEVAAALLPTLTGSR